MNKFIFFVAVIKLKMDNIILEHHTFTYVNCKQHSFYICVRDFTKHDSPSYHINFHLTPGLSKMSPIWKDYHDNSTIIVKTKITIPSLVWDTIQLIQITQNDIMDNFKSIKTKIKKIILPFVQYMISDRQVIIDLMKVDMGKRFIEMNNDNQLKEQEIKTINKELLEEKEKTKQLILQLQEENEKTKQIILQLQEENEKTKLLQKQLSESYTGLSFSQANMIGQAMFEN